MRQYYWNSDVIIDQFVCGCVGMVSPEAIACGRPGVTYVMSEYDEYEDFFPKNVTTEDKMAEAVAQADNDFWKKQYEYLEKNHKPESVVNRLLAIIDSLLSN